jgi:hypothetical protein
MDHKDLQLLRFAALDLQANGGDLVCVAGIIQRLKNWIKAKTNPDFNRQLPAVAEAYDEMKGPLGELIGELKNLDRAFKSQDVDTVARLVGEVPAIISKVTREMGGLKQKMLEANSAVPNKYVNENGEEIASEDLSRVRKGYRKNKDVLGRSWDLLPEEFRKEIPISQRIGQPLKNFSWYRNGYSAESIYAKEGAKLGVKKELIRTIMSEISSTNFKDQEEVVRLVDMGFEQFLKDLKISIYDQGILYKVDYADPSGPVEQRVNNQMQLQVLVPDVPFHFGDSVIPLYITVVYLTDRGTSVLPRPPKDLSLRAVKGIALPRKAESVQAIESAIEKDEVHEASDGPITRIVKRALVRRILPTTQVVVKISCQTFHHKAQFARILSSALRQEIDAACSVRNQDDDIEVQAAVCGTKMAALPAVYGISVHLADEFLEATKMGVSIDVVPGRSELEVVESKVLDQSFRKVAFDCWRIR